MRTDLETSSGCLVLAANWYSSGMGSVVGMVLVKCERYKVAYVGTGDNFSVDDDAIKIAEHGAKLSMETAAAEFKGWDLTDYKKG